MTLTACDCRYQSSGIVLDKLTLKPIQNVAIGKTDTADLDNPFNRKTMTNENGNYEISGVAGRCNEVILFFTKDGYETQKITFPNNSIDTILLKSITPEPKEQVNLFYDWYLTMLETGEMYQLVTPYEKEGQTRLKYQPYLDSLTKLNVFHEDFFTSELKTFRRCDLFLSRWTWKKYQLEEPLYEGYCDFLDYQRWVWSLEPVNAIEILEQSIDRLASTVKLQPMYIEGTDSVVMNSAITVQLKQESGRWLITTISR